MPILELTFIIEPHIYLYHAATINLFQTMTIIPHEIGHMEQNEGFKCFFVCLFLFCFVLFFGHLPPAYLMIAVQA